MQILLKTLESETPFHVVIGQLEVVVELADGLQGLFVEVLLPILRAALAEEDAAAQRPMWVHGARAAAEEGAA